MAVKDNSTVRWFTSEMAGAPQVDDTPGGFISVLDACLINGFGTDTPDGDKITISGGVATVHFSGGNTFEKYAVVEIEGATPAALNDVWRVTGTTATTFTFDCQGIPDGAASGSITVKRATPGFWEKAFGDNLKAAYRSTHPGSSKFFLRIDDSNPGTTPSPVRGYKNMSSVDSGVSAFPTEAQAANFVWRRTATENASYLPRRWALVADGLHFYFLHSITYQYGDACSFYEFGNLVTLSPVDEDCAMISAHESSNPTYATQNLGGGTINTNSDGYWVASSVLDDRSDPLEVWRMGYGNSPSIALGQGDEAQSPYTGGYSLVSPLFAATGSDRYAVRAFLPGLMQSLTSTPPELVTGLSMTIGEDRPILLVKVGGSGGGQTYCGFDIGGPWR